MKQHLIKAKTLKKTVSFQGVGIHSGQNVKLHCHPSENLEQGLYVKRTDLDHKTLRICPEYFLNCKRASVIEHEGVALKTPEHLLSACHALGLTHACFEIDAEECPILDGSSQEFLSAFLEAGLCELAQPIRPFKLEKSLLIKHKDTYLMALPYAGFRVSYVLDYPNHFVGQQQVDMQIDLASYQSEIAPARTYGFEAEVKALLAQNLALGGSLDNAVIIGEDAYLNPLRFPDELARHKILDIMGDLWVMQRPLEMHIVALKSGHEENRQLLQALYQVAG
eukprot:COSAG01_NODE_165_length_23303_cov_269.524953_9_plen_280_part_00